jgi:short-subunit dehydrogenase
MESVIITGASSGIGEATAVALQKSGRQVFAGARKEKDLLRLQKMGLEAIYLDVEQEESLQQAKIQMEKRLTKGNRVSLINNAGVAIGGPIEAVAIARWKEQFAVNVFGLVRATQIFLPWIRNTSGRVINISSVSGLTAIPYLGPYAASKFAVEAISDSLRREIQQFGCKVVVIEPGPIQTPIWEKGLGRKESLFAEVDPDLLPVYEQELKAFFTMVEKSAQSAVSTDKVTGVIVRALNAKNPRTRYVVGDLALAVQAALVPYLPDKLLDKMISSQL